MFTKDFDLVVQGEQHVVIVDSEGSVYIEDGQQKRHKSCTLPDFPL